MSVIAVGKVFNPVIGGGSGASITFNYVPNTVLATFTLPNPTGLEIKEFNEGEIKLKTALCDGVAFVYIKIGIMDWAELPILNLAGEEIELTRGFEQGTGYPFMIVLADTNTGVVKAMRVFGISKRFSDTINSNIDNSDKLNKNEMLKRISTIQCQRTIKDMLKLSNCYYTVGTVE